jgi:hypothetical protein
MTRVRIGQINTYVPAVVFDKKTETWFLSRDRKPIEEDVAKFLRRAAWKIPQACHEFALNLDGSNWKFNSGLWDRAKAIKEEFGGKHGIRIYASPTVTWDNDEDQWAEIREAINMAVESIKESLKSSLSNLSKKFGEMEATEADGAIVDRVNEAKNRLKRLSFVIASFALSDDFREAEKGVADVIESQLVLARIELGKACMKE